MRVLIAEDDCVSRRVLETLLRKWGHEVTVACDGEQAWRLLKDPDAPSMVILDWMMPGMDGLDVCQMLRGVSRDIRPYVILLTGKDHKADLVDGISAGADDYLTKPFEPEELRVRILAGERILKLQVESLTVMQALRKQATRDYLTGLPNRETILQLLEKEFSRVPRTHKPVAVVMADVDHFKQINDTLGHQAGDVVLAEVAKRLAMEMRSYEHIGRYGGEEFIAVLTACDAEGGIAMAERLRRAIEKEPFEVEARKLAVTVSLGVAGTEGLSSPSRELLISMADSAMYRAKRAGRNRVEATTALAAATQP